MPDSFTCGDMTFSMPTGSVMLSVSSHPVLGTMETHFRTSLAMPEGASMAQMKAIWEANGSSAMSGQVMSMEKGRTTRRNR